MKVFSFFYIAVLVCVEAISEEEILQKWKGFQEQFGKSYRSPVEAEERFGIFKDNVNKIEAHNALYEQGKTTSTEGINQFTDWTKEEFLQYVNKGLIYRPVIGEVDDSYNKSDIVISSGYSYDWRTVGVVTPVKNQGQCGSCWSFSSTGAIEGQLGRRRRLVSLSEQNLVDCSSPYGNKGCNGGFMLASFEYVKRNGIESEQSYPYRAANGKCQANPSKVVTKLSGYYAIPVGNEVVLHNALTNVGPVAVGLDATANLQSYRSGILRDSSCNSQALNHAVLAVGYGNENGLDYYILKNSWGAGWGEAGYFRLEKNNRCGIANMASYPIL